MPILSLPATDENSTTSLRDSDAARTWLATQPQAQPLRLLRALAQEIKGIDHHVATPVLRLELLDILRSAVIQAENGVKIRFAHKPLPLLDDELGIFRSARDLWHQVAAAYLRTVPLLTPPMMAQALHRGAIALREELHCHYVAGIEADSDVLRLLYEILAMAESMGFQRTPVTDPDFRHLGECTVAGDIAWAFLLHCCDPYRFSPAQLTVANRAISRWCDLAGFQAHASEDPKSKSIPLHRILGTEVPNEGGPQWLEVRPIIRKIRKRVDALQAGETPEQLKLGRELTGAACIRLMRELDNALRPDPHPIGAILDQDTVDLVFGNDNLYQLVTGKPLVDPVMTMSSTAISHDRMAVFGFDNMVNRIDDATKPKVPAESWAVENNWILRAGPAGGQVVAPLLVGVRSSSVEEPPYLAILLGLRQTADGWLAANLRFLPVPVSCGLQITAVVHGTGKSITRLPAFFVPSHEETAIPASICLPTGSGMREGSLLALEDSPVAHLCLGEILERGSNFTRFAYHPR